MHTQDLPRAALVERLKSEPRVWLRLAANRPQEEWQLSLLEVTIGEPPPSWSRRRWDYDRAVFIASTPAGATVARWLERGRILHNSVSLPFDVADRVTAERRQSRFSGIFEALPWPSVVWTVHVRSDTQQMLHGELVADNAPAFLSFDLAAQTFFGVPPSPNRGFSGRETVIREQDRRARIDSVRVRPSEAVVSVSGEKLSGAKLTLGGVGGQGKQLRRSTREVRFPLAGGIPFGSWLALHSGWELLDRRGLDRVWGQTDVEIEVDPVTEIEVLIGGGEGVSTEFKRELPPREDRKSIIGAMKTIAAFANGDGGTVLFGVDDVGTVVGLGVDNTRKTLDRVTSLITDWVRPLVDFHPEVAEIEGKYVLLVRVTAGVHPPYGVGTSDRAVTYYVRRGATSFAATPADVRAFVRARLAMTSSPFR